MCPLISWTRILVGLLAHCLCIQAQLYPGLVGSITKYRILSLLFPFASCMRSSHTGQVTGPEFTTVSPKRSKVGWFHLYNQGDDPREDRTEHAVLIKTVCGKTKRVWNHCVNVKLLLRVFVIIKNKLMTFRLYYVYEISPLGYGIGLSFVRDQIRLNLVLPWAKCNINNTIKEERGCSGW